METSDRAAQLQEIADELNRLEESPLYAYRVQNQYSPVIGEGNAHAAIMLIGEAPGEQEAKTGRPFVGASGRLLNSMLEGIGLKREDVYITNIVKDRPPENRDPKPGEITLYQPFLIRQIEIIQPHMIATLGRFAMDFILRQFDMDEQGEKITSLHGKILQTQAAYGKIAVVPLFHPAVALYRKNQRQILQDDFQALKGFVE